MRSLNKMRDNTVTASGVSKAMAANSAKGMCCRLKKPSTLHIISKKPRSTCNWGCWVRNRLRPWRGHSVTLVETACTT